jgi:hypothetical protein
VESADSEFWWFTSKWGMVVNWLLLSYLPGPSDVGCKARLLIGEYQSASLVFDRALFLPGSAGLDRQA